MISAKSAIFSSLAKFTRYNENKMRFIMDKYDLRKIDVQILAFLMNGDNRNTAKALADTEMFTKGHISQSVKRLTERGYVRCVKDKADQRVQHLYVTEEANDIVKVIDEIRLEAYKELLEGITDAELAEVQRILGKITSNIETILNK